MTVALRNGEVYMSRKRSIALFAAVVVLTAFTLAVSGCATSSTPMSSGMKSNGAGVVPASDGAPMASGMKIDPNAQNCAACTAGKVAVPTTGMVEAVDGKQVLKVSIKDGTYLPNRFTVKSGTPVTVAFTVDGKPATGCVSKPSFKQLGKNLTVTSGTKSLDLGTLEPGTYEFTCAMGRPVGKIVVQ